jgi:rRNA-processing protein FCF1
MKVIVTDTNILIDLIKTNTLYAFFDCPFEILTNDLVLSEIRDEQIEVLSELVKSGRLRIKTFEVEELSAILNLQTKFALSPIVDPSVIWQAEQMTCILLTGDGNMRKEANDRGLTVHGIIWVFYRILEFQTMRALDLMEAYRLLECNIRLPKLEFDKLKKELERQK